MKKLLVHSIMFLPYRCWNKETTPYQVRPCPFPSQVEFQITIPADIGQLLDEFFSCPPSPHNLPPALPDPLGNNFSFFVLGHSSVQGGAGSHALFEL